MRALILLLLWLQLLFTPLASGGASAGVQNALFGGVPVLNDDGTPVLDANQNPVTTDGLLSDWADGLPDGSLFGNGNLSLQGLGELGVNSVVSAGVDSIAYGTDFEDGFKNAITSGIINLAMADVQNVIGDVFDDGAHGGEGSIGHALLHGFTGCAAAELQGGDCAAGAASGMGQAFLAGALEDGHGGTLTQQQRQAALNDAQMLGAFMGYLFSGGDAGNVSLGGSIGQSGMAHNYLSHTQLEDLNTALENCEAQSTGCSEVERHAIMELYWQLSQEQDRQLASCMSQACIDWHTNRAANMVDAENIIGGSNAIIMYQLAGIENDFRNAQATAYQNLAVIEDYANFVDVRCSGTHSAECMQSYDAASNRIARLDALGQDITTVLAFVTSLGTAGAAAGLGQCVRSAHCAMRLARDIADGFGAEYAGQLTLVSAAGMGGRYVLQYGDEVVGFIDDLGDGIRVVSQIPGAERIVFDSASNTHGYFDNAGQWVDTWTVPTQIDVTFPTNIQHLLPPPANGGARPKRSPDGQYSNLYDGDTIVRDNPVRTLVQDSNGRYWLEGSSGQRITPSGQYNFVTMPDGTIRVTRPNTTVLENGEVASTHLGLSNGNSVNYAGSITFANRNSATRGSIRDWSNDSGHYQPAASDAGNAGLPTDLFNSSFD